MKKIAAFIAVLFISLMLIAPVSAYVERVGIPRLDEVIAEVESDPDIATNRFLTGEFDFMPDMIRSQNIEKLQNKSHQILTTGGFHVCYAGINTRDYVPYDAGQPDANRSLAPLNWTGFRQALGWAGLSISQKESAIAEIYGPDVVVPAYTVIPEALGVWNNPNVTKLGGNYTRAEEALNASGFTISGGLLYQPNGVVVRDTIEVLSPSEAPTSVEFCQRFVDQWNDFFDNHLGVTNCDLVNSAIPFNTEVVSAFLYRNFDLYWLCWGLSRFPDYLYDFFHSSQDFPWGYNSPGINNATLDAKIETVKWGLVYGDKLQAAYEAQEMLVEDLVPYIYFYHRNYFVGYRGSDLDTPSPRGSKLVNAINQDGFGADNGWTWSLMHWNDSVTGGDVRYVWGAEFDNL
ncbi:hypothetical protein GWN63_05145, partial [Candidatus Bathyarchaeota archaeon]|nr:hypothetical protein [Desulfobacterales bacterium]NIU81612.1 hypothetical protein [Candidatus Bathyarchaeota archaeon]NIV68254.1 hypothetical protein [Candidatus Bathyarchaeota archaeon]NIW34792.1 hypothetical protein [Candidatus Bathyarchaeota archaeon]